MQLTYVEFEILAALAGAPGRVFTREMLLEHVWGDSTYRDPRTVDVHIRHLREKLEGDPKHPEYLFTVRGVGYRFRDASATEAGRGLNWQRFDTLRNRLVLLIFAITAAAVGFVYLYVVPQLESSLTAEKLRRLDRLGSEESAAAARGRRSRAPPSEELEDLVRSISQTTESRVTLLAVTGRRGQPAARSS